VAGEFARGRDLTVKKDQRNREDVPQMPRPVKYAWGVAMTLLVVLSLTLDKGSALMPLVHRAIDALQLQTAPTDSR
jgi:hypothetical protein